jgi:hypothetical protein
LDFPSDDTSKSRTKAGASAVFSRALPWLFFLGAPFENIYASPLNVSLSRRTLDKFSQSSFP